MSKGDSVSFLPCCFFLFLLSLASKTKLEQAISEECRELSGGGADGAREQREGGGSLSYELLPADGKTGAG